MVFADFVPAGALPQLLRRLIVTPGFRGRMDVAALVPQSTDQQVDGLRFSLKVEEFRAATPSLLTFTVSDARTGVPLRDLEKVPRRQRSPVLCERGLYRCGAQPSAGVEPGTDDPLSDTLQYPRHSPNLAAGAARGTRHHRRLDASRAGAAAAAGIVRAFPRTVIERSAWPCRPGFHPPSARGCRCAPRRCGR